MKDFIKKVAAGLATGLGFSLAVVVVIYFSTELLVHNASEEAFEAAEENMPQTYGYKQYSKESGLLIKSHRERKGDLGTEILVEIENTGDTTWSSVRLEAELFDENDVFVDECSGYMSGKIAPGEVKNLKIKCGGCKDNPLPEYERYTLVISDASSF